MNNQAQQILFARHGNTFAAGDKVVWVGRKTDLDLVSSGVEQAHGIAARLKQLDLAPDHIITAGLKRTGQTARIIAEDLGLKDIKSDHRLDEIDYGAWEGLTTAEIEAKSSWARGLSDWRSKDIWPQAAGWQSTQEEIVSGLRGLLEEVVARGGRCLLVSSNGILRFAPMILGCALPERSLLLKTGALGLVERPAEILEQKWRIGFWNR